MTAQYVYIWEYRVHPDRFAEFEAACEDLTVDEREIGQFDSVEPGRGDSA